MGLSIRAKEGTLVLDPAQGGTCLQPGLEVQTSAKTEGTCPRGCWKAELSELSAAAGPESWGGGGLV